MFDPGGGGGSAELTWHSPIGGDAVGRSLNDRWKIIITIIIIIIIKESGKEEGSKVLPLFSLVLRLLNW